MGADEQEGKRTAVAVTSTSRDLAARRLHRAPAAATAATVVNLSNDSIDRNLVLLRKYSLNPKCSSSVIILEI